MSAHRNVSYQMLPTEGTRVPPSYSRFNVLINHLVFLCVCARARAVPSECPAGVFGLGCRHRCQCDNKALCDHVSGACTCQRGWTGTYCEKRKMMSQLREATFPFIFSSPGMHLLFVHVSACPRGFHGLDCQEKCLCLNGGSCGHISGHCSCPAGWIGPFCNLSELQQSRRQRCPGHGPDRSSDTFDVQGSCRGNDIVAPLLAACPSGSYGEGCNQTCSCRNNGVCHPASGQCACTSGWTGPSCTEGGREHKRKRTSAA